MTEKKLSEMTEEEFEEFSSVITEKLNEIFETFKIPNHYKIIISYN